MQRILDLIEVTLDADVTPAELAVASGYSLWHFLHLFQQEVGQPLCRYRTRRRLAHAIWAVSQGMSITDAAFRWGFESHSGFYRAFQKEYGVSPTVWLRTHRVKKPAAPLLKEEHDMLSRDKFRDALSHWGLDLPLTPVTYPGSGAISENAMYAGEDYILKAYRDEHACRLAIALAEKLQEHHIPASAAIPLPDGRTVLPLAEGLHMTFCRRMDGSPMTTAAFIRDPGQGYRIGAALAGLHRALADLEDLPYAEDEPWTDHLLHWALPKVEGILDGAFLADFAAKAEMLRDLPTALIHRDPNPSNMIDTAEGVGFIDFELSRRFVRVFDPCYTMTAVLSEVFEREELPWQQNWPLFCKAVLAGYDSVSPLTAQERAAVPVLMLGNEVLAIAAFAGSSKYKDIFDVNMRMLPWMMGNMPG